jgi:hypothetical protein
MFLPAREPHCWQHLKMCSTVTPLAAHFHFADYNPELTTIDRRPASAAQFNPLSLART